MKIIAVHCVGTDKLRNHFQVESSHLPLFAIVLSENHRYNTKYRRFYLSFTINNGCNHQT